MKVKTAEVILKVLFGVVGSFIAYYAIANINPYLPLTLLGGIATIGLIIFGGWLGVRLAGTFISEFDEDDIPN
jgi:hypothetical protein